MIQYDFINRATTSYQNFSVNIFFFKNNAMRF